MKNSILLYVTILLFCCNSTGAQNGFSKKRIAEMFDDYKTSNSALASKTYEDLIGLTTEKSATNISLESITNKRVNVIIRTPNFPQNFTKIIQDDNEEWQLSGELNLGVSYGIIFGEMEVEVPEGNGVVYPHFGVAVHVSGGTTQDFQTGGLTGNLNIGGSLIILNYVNLFLGYDVLNKSALVGLGARVDMVRFGGFGSDIINKENTFNALKNP